MSSSISTSYVIPAVLLNPILFLHSLNALLARILPPIVVDTAIQPQPYYPLGPSAQHPHLDIHASDSLCWSYTIVMVCAQLVAFGRVSVAREERKEKARRRKERPGYSRPQSMKEMELLNGHGREVELDNSLLMSRVAAAVVEKEKRLGVEVVGYERSEESLTDSSDSETIM